MDSIYKILICCLMPFLLQAQKQNNFWFFGNDAGLNFNTSPPTPLVGKLSTLEGVAAVSDSSGQLLFYTNGFTVWDRKHNVMPDGFALQGGYSSTQAAVIVPYPKSKSSYFIFCTDDFLLDNRLTYSIIDMRLNCGYGDIVAGTKNTILHRPVHEQMTSVLHANGVDVWLIVHRRNSNNFLAYLITETGLDTVPVISAVGQSYPHAFGTQSRLKASHDGKKLMSSLTYLGVLEMYDFDPATGSVSNPVSLSGFVGINRGVYGIEFSPNDSLVYFSYFIRNTGPSYLLQYELKSGIWDTLATAGIEEIGSVQLASDGKLYVARNSETFLDVIHFPDLQGMSCLYEHMGIDLVPGTGSRVGLPEPVVYSFPLDTTPLPLFGNDTVICTNEIFILTPQNITHTDSIDYLWSTGSLDPFIDINTSGTYWVMVETGYCTLTDTIHVEVSDCLPIIHFDLESCMADFQTGSNMNYTEFQPAYPRELACADIQAQHLSRIPPQEQKHSCTPGVGDSTAMCIGAVLSCNFLPGDEATLFFEFMVQPQPGSRFHFSRLEFFEQAPEEFNWINGQSGLNNFPRRYGIRILKNAVEIFRDESVFTEQVWSLEEYNFESMPDFIVQEVAVFRIEWLPYCAVGNGGPVSVWDIDEIKVFGSCSVAGGTGIVEGQVLTAVGKAIPGAEVHLTHDPVFQDFKKEITDAEGHYRFDGLEKDIPCYIRVVDNRDLLNGVNSLDIIRIQSHLLGKKVFDSWTQYIAADVNRSDFVSAMDLVEIKRALLGIITQFPGNRSWRFGVWPDIVPTSTFEDFLEIKYISSLQEGIVRINFVGIKVGDVTGDAMPGQ